MSDADAVIWHDLECGGYRADLPHWLALAERHAGAVLDVGAGTGRVALALARAGHSVLALERDAALAGELARRAEGLAVEVHSCAMPARSRWQPRSRWRSCRCRRFTCSPTATRSCAAPAGSLAPGGLLAVALLGEGVEPFELELEPDVVQIHALRYESTPTALRRDGGAVLLERRRTRIAAGGARFAAIDVTRLAACDGATLAAQARAAGFEPLESIVIEPTRRARRQRDRVPGGAGVILRVCALYPDLMNIYADRGNLLMLERRCALARHRLAAAREHARRRRSATSTTSTTSAAVRTPTSAAARRPARTQGRRAARRRRPRGGRARRLRRLPAARALLPARRGDDPGRRAARPADGPLRRARA